MPLLFAATLFVSASLLFMVQPMVAKMVLPLLGGSPAVWNACMVFFQALLLLGYLYAHHVAGKYEPKKQWAIHLFVIGLPFVAFIIAVMFGARHSPIAIAESLAPSGDSSPVLSVLALMTVAIGIPFFVVSTSAPLLQKWFAYTGHPSARDPYFLYSASNFGSMISLLGYPIFIEPNMSIVGQAWFFAVGFGILAVMVFFCGQAAANPIGVPPARGGKAPRNAQQQSAAAKQETVQQDEPPPTWTRKAKWVALAFVPSSLMLGVTFHMSTDIASIPLLWVIPLTLYLVTFIIAFGRVPDWFRILIGNLAPVMVLLLIFVLLTKQIGLNPGVGIELLLHILTFFSVALMCHYELARDRPSPKYLTEFFLIMSFGGMLGGIFNSLVAPIIFVQDYEYKVVLILSCLLVPKLIEDKDAPPRSNGSWWVALVLDIFIPLALGFAFYYLAKLPDENETYLKLVKSLHDRLGLSGTTITAILLFALPVMLCFFFVDRPVRFALCAAALLGPTTWIESRRSSIHTERSFFGILKVEQQGHFNRLVHGTTLHGTQFNHKFKRHWADDIQMLVANSPWDIIAVAGANQAYNPLHDPLTYYHRTGPVGAMVRELRTRKNGADAKADMAMVGLGTGSAACYAIDGQRLTFYEIDPAVKKIVETPWMVMNKKEAAEGQPPFMGPFTYVDDARKRGGQVDIRMGDARLKLKEDADRKFALLLVDAFSSDAIPVHLLTREAVQLYLDRMTDDGILALHISNKYVSLEPVVAQIMIDLKQRPEYADLAARVWSDNAERGRPGKTASSWVVIARKEADLGSLGLPVEKQFNEFHTIFRPLRTFKGMDVWTDDYSDVMRVMMLDEVIKLRKFFGLPTIRDMEDD